MLKTINISGNDYVMKSSAYTRFKYKNDFNRELLKDISKLEKIFQEAPKEDTESYILNNLDEILDISLMLAYTMISEFDPKFKPYHEWLKELDNLLKDITWINEVLTHSMSTFQGR